MLSYLDVSFPLHHSAGLSLYDWLALHADCRSLLGHQLTPAVCLQVMRGHSSYTSWYFVERAEISNINVNVTISLSSSILSSHAPGSVSLPENRGGLFSRVIGASGFQLINVNNVPLQLSGWSTDTKLIGRKALQGSLTRHYIGQSIKEAHKVGLNLQTSSKIHVAKACISMWAVLQAAAVHGCAC